MDRGILIAMERRRAARRLPVHGEPALFLRLRTGLELSVIDISSIGALIEGTVRLLPGTHVEVHVMTTDGRVLVRCRILRAYVFDLRSDLIRYRGALAFVRPLNLGCAAG